MKYIIFETDKAEQMKGHDFHGVAFSKYIAHNEFARRFPTWKPVSAGFLRATDDGFECYGSSDSLGLKSDKNDADFFNQ